MSEHRGHLGVRLVAIPALALIVGAGLAGCSDDKPAVCESVDNLKSSVDDVKDIDVTESGAAGELKSGLATIKSDLDEVKADAKSEFSSQLDAVNSAYATLTTSVEAAEANPTADTLTAVGTAVEPFDSAVETLISDVKSTC